MPQDNRPYTLGDAADALSSFGSYLKDRLTGPDYPDVPQSPYAKQAQYGFDWYAPPKYMDLLMRAADETGIPARILDLQYNQESRWNPLKRGSKGERGISQLMPATAKEIGVTNRQDPTQSIEGGSRYLAHLIDVFKGDPIQALKAYNVGIGNVRRGTATEKADKYVRDVFTPKQFRDR